MSPSLWIADRVWHSSDSGTLSDRVASVDFAHFIASI